VLLPLLGGCVGIQSTLDPRGPAAETIADIHWIMFWGAVAIQVLVMVLALYAVFRAPAKRRPVSVNVMIAAGGVALPLVTLSALLVYAVVSMGKLRAEPDDASMMRIEVVGNQWWWDVRYLGPDGTTVARTANEIHIPAEVPVKFLVRSNDVIHSFWVPNLAGKIDLMPGRTHHIVLQASQPGLFRGQCAEFCGAQHARMAFHVIAEPADKFASWLERHRLPAQEPVDALALRGREAFASNGCVACHAVRGFGGTTTSSERGPDLTHLADRRFLFAGTLENNRENLIDTIVRSQIVKPGNAMPSYTHIDRKELDAMLTYLKGLR
jgi:cytochrome c oxidase subunit 2